MLARNALEALNGVTATGEMVPQLATAWQLDPDKKTVTFTLRENVMFHDNTPFDADAVKWNLEMCIEHNNPAMQLVTSVEALDKTHVRINFSQYDPLFLNSLCGNTAGFIVSPTAAKKLIDAGNEDQINYTPVGTGPFKFVEFTPNVILKFAKWEGYWQEGLPYLDAVEIKPVQDATVALAAFRNKECDYLEGVRPMDVDTLIAEGYNVTVQTSAIFGLCGDSANPDSPFADIRFRKAIMYALDNESIVDSVYYGKYETTNQWAAPGGPGWDPSIVGYTYDLAKAKSLLAELNISVDTPLNLKFTYPQSGLTQDFYTALQGELAKVGIILEFDPLTGAAWNSFRMGTFNNQMTEFNSSYQVDFVYSDFLKQSFKKDSVWYKSVWTSDAYNALLETMLPETDMAKRAEYYKQLNKMLVDDCVAFPTFVKINFKAAQPYLIDMGCGDISNEYLPERAWIKQ